MDQRAAMYQSLKDEITALRKELDDMSGMFLKMVDMLDKRTMASVERETDMDVRLHRVELRVIPGYNSTLGQLNGLIGNEIPLTEKLDRKSGDELPPKK